ncbi:MAG: hypothetical protein RRZ24_03225 [Clostridia bacterium]
MYKKAKIVKRKNSLSNDKFLDFNQVTGDFVVSHKRDKKLLAQQTVNEENVNLSIVRRLNLKR